MKTLILATNDSSAGRLKHSKAADAIFGIHRRLVLGPVPSNESRSAYFGAALLQDELDESIQHWQLPLPFSDDREGEIALPSLVEVCQRYERIQIWVDPEPNAYLILFELIEELKSQPALLDRLSIVFPSRYLGELSPAEFESMDRLLLPMTQEVLELTSRCWQAHQASTPQDWFELLNQDLATIPSLRVMILRILSELPAVTNGLSASETQLLTIIKRGDANFEKVFSGYLPLRPRPTLDYWEAGQRIVSLSRCDPPIILNVEEERFSLEIHDDETRFNAFRARNWSLSKIGHQITDGTADFCDHVAIDRWVGNTHLTPDQLWRWDAASESLVEPE